MASHWQRLPSVLPRFAAIHFSTGLRHGIFAVQIIDTMTATQIQLVKRSWTLVASLPAEEVGQLFYGRLFELAPHLQHLFRNPQPEQSRKLIAMIQYVIGRLDTLEDIFDEVSKLARRHVQYGVKEEHYQVVGQALLWTLEKGLDKFWHHELKEAWIACYTTLEGAMINDAYPATASA